MKRSRNAFDHDHEAQRLHLQEARMSMPGLLRCFQNEPDRVAPCRRPSVQNRPRPAGKGSERSEDDGRTDGWRNRPTDRPDGCLRMYVGLVGRYIYRHHPTHTPAMHICVRVHRRTTTSPSYTGISICDPRYRSSRPDRYRQRRQRRAKYT